MKEIKNRSYIKWRYFPAEGNPVDTATRECTPQNLPKDWLLGTAWPQGRSIWSPNIITEPTCNIVLGTKFIKKIL